MTSPISRIKLTDRKYVVKQKAIRNSYKVYNSAEEEVLRTKQKLFKIKEEFPFIDSQGNEVFTVKAESIMDIAGDYAVIDSRTENKIAVLRKEFTLLTHKWKIEDGERNSIATVESRGKLFGALRGLSDIFDLLPHKYTVRDSKGDEIGFIKQSFTLLRDKYEIEIDETVENRESIIAASITVDALEGN